MATSFLALGLSELYFLSHQILCTKNVAITANTVIKSRIRDTMKNPSSFQLKS